MAKVNVFGNQMVLARKPANLMASLRVSADKKRFGWYLRNLPSGKPSPAQEQVRARFAQVAIGTYGQKGKVDGLSPAAVAIQSQLQGTGDKGAAKRRARAKASKRHQAAMQRWGGGGPVVTEE